ncbi:uncharacterized protein LOC108462679 [Gossypium arboreum]|uniref:uncharacterized protein LOC108462679 n=1 Tax=Gossypium arboreum TaxID=29729 RepID=UPI0008197A8A|nr:uncharacterized protein LOC108462679 [Gossypium arboreum]
MADNTLFARELLRGYNRKYISPSCTLKVDLQKAWDPLNSGFILSVLKVMSFLSCLSSGLLLVSLLLDFPFLIIGGLLVFFRGEREIRQGDLYLFVVAMNALSRILEEVAQCGVFKYHPKCLRVKLSHLSFADDLLIFAKGSVVLCISEEEIELIRSITGFKIGQLLVRYLGVPLCRQFLLPKAVLRKIAQICVRFFWKVQDCAAHGARVSRFLICSPKSEGGLGLRDLEVWNNVCILQHIRSILAEEGSLSIAWNKDVQRIPISSKIASSRLWEDIRDKGRKVCWHRLFWFSLHIPKHSIVAWMADLNWLPTRDRLSSLGLNVDGRCVLCS